ncbi:MAG: dihydropteroate synthase [Dehalococcoidia bacterium]|nr:MAG: dihydropteroate synthase [Dehalococcoidia bacterium]
MKVENRKAPGVTKCKDTLFRWGTRTYIMGIVNLSPDSFSGDGLVSVESALEQARKMVEDGADIIDVGGESTRPSSNPVSVEEEIARIVPFIKLASKVLSVPVSVDTYRYETARQALDAGADIINDISGLREAPGLEKLAAERSVPIILTSNERGQAVTNIMEAITGNLKKLISAATEAGVLPENTIIDPGIGFGKTPEQNLEIMRRLDELKKLKRPILLGTSRKSFIGKVLSTEADDRVEGTAATIAIGIVKGADIVRVHDVRHMGIICRMSDAIVRNADGSD